MYIILTSTYNCFIERNYVSSESSEITLPVDRKVVHRKKNQSFLNTLEKKIKKNYIK